ncbi:MAG TPA: alpha/beta hydrolase [Solirubrobacterales bacterium]|jgi:lipase|nr:alpha/beta hydrolase [Solirubrobacterales bacterium]
MVLKTRRWGTAGADSIVCVHGVTQHGGIFEALGQRLADRGRSVLAVDLRGHGDSEREPPWDIGTHVGDLIETLDDAGIERATWIGHSFGGRLVAQAAAGAGERSERLVLLDPALEVPAAYALRSAEIERLDWSFATADGALNAMLSSDSMVAPPRDVVAAFVRDDIRKGPDGRFRFSFCPSTVVVAWSEMALPAPPIAPLPTLVVRPAKQLFDATALERRYQDELGELLTAATVPNGHNMLWEAPTETTEAVERFLGSPR